MIAKKIMKNQKYTKTRAQDASDLCRYILDAKTHMVDRPTTEAEQEKVLCTGALGFVFSNNDAQIGEMGALASCARSGDPIVHFVLSWPENEQPSQAQLHEAAKIFTKEIGMEGHQVIYGAHQNTDNIHLHLAINRVDPQTERVVKINKGFDHLAAHKAICTIEHVQGWSHEKNAVYQYTASGPVLVQGRERSLSDGAKNAEKRTGETSLERRAKALSSEIALATSWQDLHLRLAAQGITYEKRKGGAVIKFGNHGFIKASVAGRDCSLKNLEKRFGSSFERAHIAPKPYEVKPLPIRKDIDIVQLLLATILKLFGLHAAARQILHTKQQLERDELRQAKFQSAKIKWAAQSILKEEHKIQREELAKAQEKEVQSLKTMSKQELIQYCEEKQLLTEEPHMDRKEIFEKFAAAMGADRYRITSKLDALGYGMSEQEINRQTFVFGKKEDILAGKIQANEPSRGYTASEVLEQMPKISGIGDNKDRGTYVTPLASGVHYIVVDDIRTPERLEAVRALEPSYVGESSQGNFQAVLKIHAVADPDIARAAANAVAVELNTKYGDPQIVNGSQAFRLPGFENHKPKHQENGIFPVVQMHHAEPVFSEKTQEIYDGYVKKIELERAEKELAAAKEMTREQTPAQEAISDWSPRGVRYVDLYGIHAIDAVESMRRSSNHIPTGRNLDFMVGIKLRSCGYTEPEAAKILAAGRLYNDEVRKGDTSYQTEAIEAARGAAIAQEAYHSPAATKQMIAQAHHVHRWLQREKTVIKQTQEWYKKENMQIPEFKKAKTIEKENELER